MSKGWVDTDFSKHSPNWSLFCAPILLLLGFYFRAKHRHVREPSFERKKKEREEEEAALQQQQQLEKKIFGTRTEEREAQDNYRAPRSGPEKMGSSKDDSPADSNNEALASNQGFFSEGERVLAYHGPLLYEAKVLLSPRSDVLVMEGSGVDQKRTHLIPRVCTMLLNT